MALMVFGSWGAPTPYLLRPGNDLVVPHEVIKFGTARTDPIENVRVDVFQYASDGSKTYMTDRDNVLLQNVAATVKDGDVYLFTIKTKTSSAVGLWYVRWYGTFRGEDLPPMYDRFILDAKSQGDVEFVGVEPS